MVTEPDERPALNKRLEQARIEVGAPTLRAFYARLKEVGVPRLPTYKAAASYHNAPWREPPVRYLQAITRRFPTKITAEWLLNGTEPYPGEVTHAEYTEQNIRGLREYADLVRRLDEAGIRFEIKPQEK